MTVTWSAFERHRQAGCADRKQTLWTQNVAPTIRGSLGMSMATQEKPAPMAVVIGLTCNVHAGQIKQAGGDAMGIPTGSQSPMSRKLRPVVHGVWGQTCHRVPMAGRVVQKMLAPPVQGPPNAMHWAEAVVGSRLASKNRTTAMARCMTTSLPTLGGAEHANAAHPFSDSGCGTLRSQGRRSMESVEGGWSEAAASRNLSGLGSTRSCFPFGAGRPAS